MQNLLSLLLLLPLSGALLTFAVGRHCARTARWISLISALVTFAASLMLLCRFDPAIVGYQFEEQLPWFEGYAITYHVGVDGISLWMVMLTTLLTPICMLCSWRAIQARVPEFMILFLLLETLVLGTFLALDLLLFYLFFEAVLIPMYLIIGIWGGSNRVYAAYKFFLYTLAGSVLFLLAVLYLYFTFGTMDIPELSARAPSLGLGVQKYLWLAFFASFAVKVPMWPLHTWLPDAHVQAPTAGSVILAGILLKLGAYGFLRFSLPMLPAASHAYAPLVFTLSIVAIIYTSLVALVQEDMKKLIAYSSVAHMGFVTMGIFSFTQQGLDGALFQMISHGLISGALFLCVGVVYDRLHTREIVKYGGVVNVMPVYAAFFLVFTMASAGLPATSGFVGEMLVLVGTYKVAPLVAVLAATSLILGAAYMLWLYRRVVYGEITNAEVKTLSDLSRHEWLTLSPLLLLVLWYGISPPALSHAYSPVIARLVQAMEPHADAAAPSPESLEKR